MIKKLDLSRIKVGLQVGEKAVKVIVLQKHKKQWRVKQKIAEPLATGIVKEGKVMQPDLLGLKIKEVFTNHGIKAKKVSIFVEELLFFVRHTKLPKMPRKEVERAIHYQAQTEIPVDVSQLKVACSHVGTVTEKGRVLDQYMIFAAYASHIEPMVEAVKKAGLSVSNFGLEPDAIYEGLKTKEAIDAEKPILLVRVDTRRMMLAIYLNDKLMYCRYVPFSPEKKDWDLEIELTILSWNRKHGDQKIAEVMLLGEKEYWDEFINLIEQFMPLNVRTFHRRFVACAGIALKDGSQRNFYSDVPLFLSPDLTPAAKITIPLAIFLLSGFVCLFVSNHRLEQEIAVLETKIHQPMETVALMEERKQLEQTIQQFTRRKQTIEARHVDILTLAELISSHQPANVKIMQMTFSEHVIRLSGSAHSLQDVTDFLKGLQEEPRLSYTKIIHSSQDHNGTQFSIEIELEQKGDG
jgi:Tfp pilus assembly protein PilN